MSEELNCKCDPGLYVNTQTGRAAYFNGDFQGLTGNPILQDSQRIYTETWTTFFEKYVKVPPLEYAQRLKSEASWIESIIDQNSYISENMIVNLSPENNEWNKEALAFTLAERERKAAFGPLYRGLDGLHIMEKIENER